MNERMNEYPSAVEFALKDNKKRHLDCATVAGVSHCAPENDGAEFNASRGRETSKLGHLRTYFMGDR